MQIRRAETKDIDTILLLLRQVLELHAQLRPDIFKSGTEKYTREELDKILFSDATPVFVAENDEQRVVGYIFCVLRRQPFGTTMRDFKTLFIDDFCVDSACRGQHVGKALFDFALQYAKSQDCYDVTLNVWEGNDNARAFYEKMGMFPKETQMEILVK